MKYAHVYALFLLFVFCISCKGQNKTDLPKGNIKSENKEVISPDGPKTISRNIIQDRNGNIWVAAFDGIFRFDGKLFTNITSKVSSARFFSILEDRNGNLWFGSIGSGVFYYNGKSFKNFTTREGLLNNEVVSIYEDKKGNIWFGVSGGASRYDGKSFRNYIIEGNTMYDDQTGKTFSDRLPFGVNSIFEDKTGGIWFATTDNILLYDGKTFSVFAHEDKPFKNVNSIIEDKKGNIWLGGADGLWRYDGGAFINLTQKFGGYLYEDKKGNIWTSSGIAIDVYNGLSGMDPRWILSCYDEKSLSDRKPTVTEIKLKYEKHQGMIFGILKANDGSIWIGASDGVYRYDGNALSEFKGQEVVQ